MQCPACAAPLPESAIASSLSVCRCPSCNAVSDLLAKPKPVVTVPMPEKWSVEGTGRALTIRWPWLKASTVILVPFTLFWNGVLLSVASGMTDDFAHPEKLLFGLLVPHVWIGVGLLYFTLATFLNSTTVKVRNGELTVHHGPLPWRGNHHFLANALVQLFVVEKRSNRGTLSYDVCGLSREGKRQQIIRLEQPLGLRDAPVEGEFRRNL